MGNNKNRECFLIPRISLEQVKLPSVQCEASPIDCESAFTIVITTLQGQPFDRDDLDLLNLFLDKKKLILRLMFNICIKKRKLYQVIEHLRKL